MDPNQRFIELLASTPLPSGDAIQRSVNRLLPRLGVVNAAGRVRFNVEPGKKKARTLNQLGSNERATSRLSTIGA